MKMDSRNYKWKYVSVLFAKVIYIYIYIFLGLMFEGEAALYLHMANWTRNKYISH